MCRKVRRSAGGRNCDGQHRARNWSQCRLLPRYRQREDFMSVAEQVVTDRYAIYNGDCISVMASLPEGAVHLSIYSPPFAGLYQYSSSERDLSNSRSYDEFFEHYGHVVRGLFRLTMPG